MPSSRWYSLKPVNLYYIKNSYTLYVISLIFTVFCKVIIIIIIIKTTTKVARKVPKRETDMATFPQGLILTLLMLAGDIQVNPGPVKYPCSICLQPVRKGQMALLFDECDQYGGPLVSFQFNFAIALPLRLCKLFHFHFICHFVLPLPLEVRSIYTVSLKMDDLLKAYFLRGYSYRLILCFLFGLHGIK